MGLAHAFGFAGGARGVQNDGYVFRLHCLHHGVPGAGVIAVPLLAQLFELRDADQTGGVVFAQAAWVVVNDVLNAGYRFTHFQQLVDLLLVLCKCKCNLGILDDKTHFLRDGILVQRNGDCAQALHRNEPHVKAGAVVADEGEILPLGQTQRSQATCHLAHVTGSVCPAPCLPNAVFLLAQCSSRGPFGSMPKQQMRKCCCHCRSSQIQTSGQLVSAVIKHRHSANEGNTRQWFDVFLSFQRHSRERPNRVNTRHLSAYVP